ncbi:MAG TPA: hypothetical protein VGN23_08185 [Verrucomicrobiae bacterium]|jgi:hypothetical protein
MKAKLILLGIVSVFLSAISSQAQPVVVANDTANNPQYAPQPDHNWSVANGGFGYNLWTPLSDGSGGGTFMEGVGVNNRQVDGNYSFALYSGSGSYDISRPLSTSLTGLVEFDIVTRFDVSGTGLNAVDLRTGNNTSSFSAGDLLTFGLQANGGGLAITDGSGTDLLPSGEARGSVWSWDVLFNTTAGTYTLSVTNLSGGYFDQVSGNLDASGTSVGSFAVINSSTGSNQNVIFDQPTFTVVPEPVTAAFLGISGFGALMMIRRRK